MQSSICLPFLTLSFFTFNPSISQSSNLPIPQSPTNLSINLSCYKRLLTARHAVSHCKRLATSRSPVPAARPSNMADDQGTIVVDQWASAKATTSILQEGFFLPQMSLAAEETQRAGALKSCKCLESSLICTLSPTILQRFLKTLKRYTGDKRSTVGHSPVGSFSTCYMRKLGRRRET